MSTIENISISIAGPDDMLTGQAEAVLTEVAEMLRRLIEQNIEDSIDLRSLPLSTVDRKWLDRQLGHGEVEILLEAGGRSVMTETAYPGVWRITHRDGQDRVVAEFVEVAWVPNIVKPDAGDVKKGYESLLLKLDGKSAGA
jgi:hydrogenase-1 operon protein HyaF